MSTPEGLRPAAAALTRVCPMWPQARIDLDALRSNLQRVYQLAPRSRVMAVIKANGYGHGLLRVARALRQADGFAVARLDEGLQLRAAGSTHPVLLLEGLVHGEELREASEAGLEVVVHHLEQVSLLEQTPLRRPLRVWIKLDTGMHRLGFLPAQLRSVLERVGRCSSVASVPRVMTHLANSDIPADERNRAQLEAFESALRGLALERSIANSGAVLSWPRSHGEWVRPGIMLYGVSPVQGSTGPELGLEPVMTLVSRLIAVNHHARGAAIGYGGAWVCPEDMRVGVVAIGYGDGYPRHAISGTPVLIRGRRVPLVGRVSMDMITVDLRGVPEAQVGDEVLVWGRGLPVEEVADRASTIGYELLCGVSQRVHFLEC